MKLDKEKFEIDPDKLTLGEAALLKREYGMEDFASFNFFDPEQMIGLFVVAVKRKHPDRPEADVRTAVEGVENGPVFVEINRQLEEAVAKAKAEKENPPSAGDVPPATGPGTRPKKPGPPK